MGKVVTLARWRLRPAADTLGQDEVFVLTHQIRATARALGVEREAYFYRVLAEENIEELNHLNKDRLVPLIQSLHAAMLEGMAGR